MGTEAEISHDLAVRVLEQCISTGEVGEMVRASRGRSMSSQAVWQLTKRDDFPAPVSPSGVAQRLWLRPEVEAYLRGGSSEDATP